MDFQMEQGIVASCYRVDPASLGRDFTNRLSNLTFGFIQDLQATSLNASVTTFDR